MIRNLYLKLLQVLMREIKNINLDIYKEYKEELIRPIKISLHTLKRSNICKKNHKYKVHSNLVV
ncbi:hypothetical protein CFB3_43680 [Clostridium folliculivorans]|uniref:Uncharacterized protein n=1 Tax=Clostridium folliculivorans TaxID=2886038 RepID=A0A9W5Y6E7_9CLOT|nr:hypothetical protein CFOLD11_42360 [Clostridium folliculivorans]GKU32260.1 hypothetical protein CFB3_43680 [Clostridium folliculivorans]